MKHTIRQVFHSSNFIVGFCIFMGLLLMVLFYPLFVPDKPLEIIGQGTFFPPGTYVSTYDAMNTPQYILNLSDAAANRINKKLGEQERQDIKTYLVTIGIPEDEIDTTDTILLLDLWLKNYDPAQQLAGMTYSTLQYYKRLDASLEGLLSTEDLIIADVNSETSDLEQTGVIKATDFVNIREIPNVRVLPLGTDNFGRDVLTELVKATGVSLLIGLVAGITATLIGLVLGLLAGYVGGVVDDIISFITNLFLVIPSFVLLILISFSIGQNQRGPITIAIVIGLTSWVWTTKAIRSQVISLRNRDHVNLSKLSGHSIVHIIIHDILPYIASYVIMALILQISSAILVEATLSILGLGPRTTQLPTLGLMMNWAMIYQAHILGKWWAFFPVLLVIALISFSMNLMNTGLDQIFNPALRED